ncbi:MAG: glycosyltransferase family 4 protein [Methanoregula sp.]
MGGDTALKIRNFLASLIQLPYGRLGLKQKEIFFVGGDEWSFYWDAYYIRLGMELLKIPIHSTKSPWGLRRQIIHFSDRYAFFGGPFSTLDRSNRIILTWFHGDRMDPNKDMQELFTLLGDADPYIDRYLVSCSISRNILISEGISPERIITIPLGVDLTRFSPATHAEKNRIRESLGIPDGAFCIGSFQKDGTGWGDGDEPKLVKGPDIFLNTIKNAYNQHKHLFVLLTGPARGYVKEGLKKAGIPFIYHNVPDYLDIVRFYHAVDLTLITSRAEGGPKAFLESWATGVPVISTRVGMPADYIINGQNGLIADIGDETGLLEHVTAMVEKTELREQCSRNALNDVKQFDWNRVTASYYNDLYKPCIDEI